MQHKTQAKLNGAAIALAVASMVGCAQTSTTESSSASSAMASTNTVDVGHCYGVNQCKGHNDCKTASNACKGHGSCKGQGFVAMPTKACGDIGGTVKDAWRGKANVTDLSHCYNVNVCKGHNDCKTAENACKGQAVCKGHGFVVTSAKSCADVGGKVS
ncbi:MAG: hypothetical protein ACI8WB_002940 [Phenylobacterium sp.]|jgi:hypothetical protein